MTLDVAVIGAGPCGLAVGVAAKRLGLTCSLFVKGPVVASLMRYPLYMTFFSTPDKLEIARWRSTSSWMCDSTTRCRACNAGATGTS